MKRIELTISTNYVSDWGIPEGIREFVQNALDQEVQSAGKNKFIWSYDKCTDKLSIGSLKSVLDTKTLLLGMSTKQNDAATVGQFGEGYKLGCLALLRAKCPVTIYNYGAKEIWHPHLIKSRRFGSTILVFDIESVSIWKRPVNADLTFVIEDISHEQFDNLSQYILPFNPPTNIIKTDKGSILFDDKYRQKVYINGLYVSDFTNLRYGYDIPAKYLTLDRDRRMARDFDVSWATSAIWALSDRMDLIIELLSKPKETDDSSYYSDAWYVQSISWDITFNSILSSKAYQSFLSKHGNKAVPVCSEQERKDYTKRGYKAVVSLGAYAKLVRSAPEFNCPELPTVTEQLLTWYKTLCSTVEVPTELDAQFKDLYEIIRNSMF